jgi:hypothetical protein
VNKQQVAAVQPAVAFLPFPHGGGLENKTAAAQCGGGKGQARIA